MATVNLRAAGSDIGATAHWVAVPAGRDPQPVRRCGAGTADLEAMADWLSPWGMTTVALESTGGYWLPLGEVLAARGVAVVRVEARAVPRAPGRPQSDVPECQWRQRLPT